MVIFTAGGSDSRAVLDAGLKRDFCDSIELADAYLLPFREGHDSYDGCFTRSLAIIPHFSHTCRSRATAIATSC